MPLLPAAVLLGLLLPVASLDPARGVTASNSPFTDEAWYALYGRLAYAAMSAPVPILVSRPDSGVNAGDLYAEAGVRWVVAGPDERPGWVDLHPEAWAGRREVLCFPWGGSAEPVCLFQIP